MLNEKELNISNQSYTKKDFATIYPELVDVIRTLTNRWDPKTSNESDPGVVLTKENAFIGDKLNYNVDKNILEAFMPSCTQETSMRYNCESRGYEMGYYNAAETYITFTYNGEALNNDTITLKAFNTVVKSQDDSIFYVVTQNVEFSKDNLVMSVPAIEGSLEQLTVASSSDEYLIQLVNLDDNNRIYFPVRSVAQNGVFISNSRGLWKKVSNLNVEQPGQPIYKFGYSSQKGLPYVEFPLDIASLIDSGLTINYITTSGRDGNVQASYLTALAKTVGVRMSGSETSEYIPNMEGDSPDLYIKNESAAINGANPQTVDEAYESYRRTIGVFDTLVTCRDYESAIYSMLDSSDIYPVVSNVNVADRRDDINYGVRYLSFNGDNSLFVNYKTSVDITAYDLCVYSLSPMYSNNLEDYYQSFIPMEMTSWMEEGLEMSKCISHDYKKAKSSDIWAVKNLATLDAKVVTTYKVNSYERAQIINNIQQALIDNFNARKVDYGYEIPYDTILKVIQNADSRISFVSLAEPELETTYMTVDTKVDSKKVSQFSKTGLEDYFTIVVARNVLEGKVSLLNFDDRFAYDFGQSATKSLANLSRITSLASISLSANTAYTLKTNEVIQIVGPSLLTDKSYSAYVYYCWSPNNSSDVIPPNTNYQLKTGDKLYFYYVDSNSQVHQDVLEANAIVQSNISISKTEQSSGSGRIQKEYNGTSRWYNTLGAQDHVDTKKLNQVELTNTTNCYWLRKNSKNALFSTSDETSIGSGIYEILLQDDEYFFYTDAGFNTLYTLGSGTTLKTSIAPTNGIWEVDRASTKDILEQGLLQLKSKWKEMNFSVANYLNIQENSIVTLIKGNSIKTSEANSLNNILLPLNGTCEYTIDGTPTPLEQYNIAGMNWRIRSRLDIIASKDKEQTLESGQSVIFLDNTTPVAQSLSIGSGESFNLNLATDLAGGILIDVSSLNAENETTYPLSVYAYTLASPSDRPSRVTSKYWTMRFDAADSKAIDMPIAKNKSGTAESSILTVYLPQNGVSFTITSDSTTPLKLYKNSTLTSLTTQGIYTIAIPNDATELYIASDAQGNIILDVPRFYDGYNPTLGVVTICKYLKDAGVIADADNEASDVYDIIETYIKSHSDGNFYYGASLDDLSLIEYEDLSSPYAFYDSNNAANKCTITQIDISNSNIDVVRSSRL